MTNTTSTFDVPVNITVVATTEQRAEEQVFDFLKEASKDYGTEFRIKDWEYFEFIPEFACCGGCRDTDQ